MACKRVASFTLIAACVAASAFAQAEPQSPAQAARKVRSQNAASRPVRLYTNDDINRLKPGGISILGVALDPVGAAQADRLSQEDRADRDRTEAEWRARFAAARQQIARTESEIQELQRLVNEETSRNTNIRGEYVGAWVSPLQRELGERLQQRKTGLARMKQELTEMEDDLRRAGGYPGWAR